MSKTYSIDRAGDRAYVLVRGEMSFTTWRDLTRLCYSSTGSSIGEGGAYNTLVENLDKVEKVLTGAEFKRVDKVNFKD
jgi:hypothetical protein